MNRYASYGEVNVRVRNGECIGWAPFYQKATRDACGVGRAMCRPLPDSWRSNTTGRLRPMAAIEALEGGVPVDMTPYRCCVDYTTSYMNYGDTILHLAESKVHVAGVKRAFAMMDPRMDCMHAHKRICCCRPTRRCARGPRALIWRMCSP